MTIDNCHTIFSIMKKISFLLLITLFVAQSALCVPAYPKRIPVVVDSDTVYIYLKGDEYCKYATDDEGYSLLPVESGWYYAWKDTKGNAIPSEFKLVAREKQSPALRYFLKNQSKGIMPLSNIGHIYRNIGNTDYTKDANKIATGFRRVLIILMQFRDKNFTKSKEDFLRLFNETGYNEDGAKGSVRDYYDYVSYGQLDLQSDVLGPYTSMQNMAFYGANNGIGGGDQNPYALFEEALENVTKEINLADYDADGDGYVDNIHIIYAGYGEEAGSSANAIWAHEMTFPTITVQGVKINKYSCAPELRGNMGYGISRIGPHCHEIGHALGAMDYYDTDYETNGYYQGTGQWDIMASGSWNNDGICPANFNPYVKVYNYGWSEARTLQTNAENIIEPSSEKNNIYRIETGNENDFYLMEFRQKTFFDEAVPGEGLLMFHIGPGIKEKSQSNTINSTYPQQCYPVCASSTYPKPSESSQSYGDINSSGCPFPGSSRNSLFSDESTPSALSFEGNRTGINLSDIRIEGDHVALYCGESGSIPSDEPDIPVEDGNVVWQEDFEGLKLSEFWSYKDSIGMATLKIRKKLMGNDTPKFPNAAHGQGLAEYIPSSNMIGKRRSCGRLISGSIQLDGNNRHVLSCKVRKYNIMESPQDSLHVKIQTEFGTETYSKVIEQQEEWETFSMELPSGTQICCISICFYTENQSVIFIDDIRITEVEEYTGIAKSVQNKSDTHINVYDIMGRKTSLDVLGLKIIKMNNGKTIKIFTRK